MHKPRGYFRRIKDYDDNVELAKGKFSWLLVVVLLTPYKRFVMQLLLQPTLCTPFSTLPS